MSDFIRVEMSGFDELSKMFPHLEKEIEQEIKDVIAASALLIQNMAKNFMRSAKHGKTYRRGSIKRGKKVVGAGFHRASAPGEAPAVDTGRLINSINHRLTDAGFTALIGIEDVSKVRYAKHLEYGTRNIRPRPWLIPSLERNRIVIEKRAQQAIENVLRKARGL